MEKELKIPTKTFLPIGAVVLVAVVAMSYGILYYKVESMDKRLVRIEDKFDRLTSLKLSVSSQSYAAD